MPLFLLLTYLTFCVAIILIFKHAAILCLSDISVSLALKQAVSNYHQANILSKIQEHFPASYEEYSTEQFIGFIMDTNFGLSSLASIRIISDAIFRVINTMKSGTLHVKKRLLWSELTFVSFEVYNCSKTWSLYCCLFLLRHTNG